VTGIGVSGIGVTAVGVTSARMDGNHLDARQVRHPAGPLDGGQARGSLGTPKCSW
jgi:hypothetical protein